MSDINQITLVVGDWSNDGHGRTDTYVVKVNCSRDDVQKAYELGTKKVGFNLTEDVCADYQIEAIRIEQLKQLKDAGIELEALKGGFDLIDGGEASITAELYASLYMAIVCLGDPTIRWEFGEDESLHIGGYGLYP